MLYTVGIFLKLELKVLRLSLLCVLEHFLGFEQLRWFKKNGHFKDSKHAAIALGKVEQRRISTF